MNLPPLCYINWNTTKKGFAMLALDQLIQPRGSLLTIDEYDFHVTHRNQPQPGAVLGVSPPVHQ
ncbi:hypothetical protein PGTUg99_015112 [Puccinia graminis f. sp. tritici]|uniref:Uncharacterized protein n=1 Tax=Puccinia graminis f. sp. tritici TaxID=56615 RepID=A0A5B0NVP5_PUCGR|nr:hypothetical protein PGTUg99_015112 [Puccinia graminis f. sp. tritici]